MLAIPCLSCALIGCASASPVVADSRALYQPPVLRLPADLPVRTTDGTYTPQTAEIWHSDARFRAVEAQAIDAAAALAALQQREGAR